MDTEEKVEESWPVTFDFGTDTQSTLDEYCQPCARPSIAVRTAEEELEPGSNDETKAGLENESYHVKSMEYSSLEAKLYEFPDLKVTLRPATFVENAGRNTAQNFSFLVSSHALCMASKVWKLIINPTGLEPYKALGTEEWNGFNVMIMDLEDDDPEALLTIFRIVHFQTDLVPKSLPFPSVRNLAVVCDKYGCGNILKPWTKIWLKNYKKDAINPGFEDWLFISKVFDRGTKKRNEISKCLIAESSSLSVCGNYLYRKGDENCWEWSRGGSTLDSR